MLGVLTAGLAAVLGTENGRLLVNGSPLTDSVGIRAEGGLGGGVTRSSRLVVDPNGMTGDTDFIFADVDAVGRVRDEGMEYTDGDGCCRPGSRLVEGRAVYETLRFGEALRLCDRDGTSDVLGWANGLAVDAGGSRILASPNELCRNDCIPNVGMLILAETGAFIGLTELLPALITGRVNGSGLGRASLGGRTEDFAMLDSTMGVAME